MIRPVICLAVGLAFCASSLGADPPAAESRYYILLFGSSAGTLTPNRTHTFATYVKATPTAEGAMALEPVTISWIASDLRVKPRRGLIPERGVNLGLQESIESVRRQGQEVALWGPYQTDASRYEGAVRQLGIIQSGTYRYRAIPPLIYRPNVSNCIGTVVRADPALTTRRPPAFQYGQNGSAVVADWLEQVGAIDRTTTHDWLIPALGLDRYPLVRK